MTDGLRISRIITTHLAVVANRPTFLPAPEYTMSSLIRTLFVLGLAFVLGSVALADEKDKKPAKKPEPYANVFSFPKKIKATDEQQQKLDALKKEYLSKLEEIDAARKKLLGEINKKKLDLLTAEQKEQLKTKPKDKKKEPAT